MFNSIGLLLGILIFAFQTSLTQAQLDGRIVGGINTTIEQHPYQLSLELMESHYCGASLIKPNVALTAAHCTSYPPNLYRVRAGSTFRESGGYLAQITNICTHPKYQSNDYDVSVLHLDQSFPLSASIQTITLQSLEVKVPFATQATATGWGTLKFAGSASSTLQEVNVPKVSDVECHISYPNSITDRMTCYGYRMGGKDSCQGDSGGPLVVDGKQVGIVSWGEGCAFRFKPGVYVRVENKDIIQHINYCLENF